jgi:hypothetical protein
MLVQQLLNGLVAGATYALFALGFTLMFGVLRVINLTYGVYFSAGAFIALAFTRNIAPTLWLALPAAALATGLLAVLLDGLLLTRLRSTQAPELPGWCSDHPVRRHVQFALVGYRQPQAPRVSNAVTSPRLEIAVTERNPQVNIEDCVHPEFEAISLALC